MIFFLTIQFLNVQEHMYPNVMAADLKNHIQDQRNGKVLHNLAFMCTRAHRCTCVSFPLDCNLRGTNNALLYFSLSLQSLFPGTLL